MDRLTGLHHNDCEWLVGFLLLEKGFLETF